MLKPGIRQYRQHGHNAVTKLQAAGHTLQVEQQGINRRPNGQQTEVIILLCILYERVAVYGLSVAVISLIVVMEIICGQTCSFKQRLLLSTSLATAARDKLQLPVLHLDIKGNG